MNIFDSIILNVNGREVSYKIENDMFDVSGLIQIASDTYGDLIIDPSNELNNEFDVETLLELPQFTDFDDESETIVRFDVNSLFYQMALEWFGFKACANSDKEMDIVDNFLQCTCFKDSNLKYMVIKSTNQYTNFYNMLLPFKYRKDGVSPNQFNDYFTNHFIKNDIDENNPIEKARQAIIKDIRKDMK